MKSVFITGAAGFIGSHIAAEFVRRGMDVTALIHKRRSERLDRLCDTGRVAKVEGDIRERSSLDSALRTANRPFDAIIHCAGRASDTGWRREFRRANLESVRHLVDLSKEFDVPRFVFVSTTDVYGLRDFRGESENELPLGAHPLNAYPEFKILAEELIRTELPPDRFSILRPGQVWGSGDTTLSARIVAFLRWSPWIVHFGKWNGGNRWPLAHVRNVATAAYLAATMPEAAGRAINVLDNDRTTIDQFYRILAAVYLPRKTFRTVTIPFAFGAVIGAIVSAVSGLLNLDRPFIDPSLYALYSVSRNLDFSNSAFRQLMDSAGLSPVTLRQGIDELEDDGCAPR